MIASFALVPFAAFAQESCPPQEVTGFTEPAKTVEVASREPGIIAKLHVELGDAVAKGEILAELDKTIALADLSVARAAAKAAGRLAIAEAHRNHARDQLEQIQKLRRSGAARPIELMEAKAQLDVASAEVEAALDERASARANLARAEARLSLLDIRAPFDGVVDEVHRRESELSGASGDARVVTVIELDRLHVEFFAPAPCLVGIAVGDYATVAAERNGVALEATVIDLSREVDAPTGFRGLLVEIENPDRALIGGERMILRLPPPKPEAKR